MKRLLLCSLLPVCVYAADNSSDKPNKLPEIHPSAFISTENDPYQSKEEKPWHNTATKADAKNKSYTSPVQQYLECLEAQDQCGGTIIPSSFNEYGKAILTKYINTWFDAAKENKIPKDKGLAKIFYDMCRDGADQIMNDKASLKKANEYLDDYNDSPSADIEEIIAQRLNPGKDGNYYFPGAEESNVDRLRITRQHEFINIMYKRHEAPIMPESKLVEWYYDQTTASALATLKLNIDNTKLKESAIRGITLLMVYKYQNDKVAQ